MFTSLKPLYTDKQKEKALGALIEDVLSSLTKDGRFPGEEDNVSAAPIGCIVHLSLSSIGRHSPSSRGAYELEYLF